MATNPAQPPAPAAPTPGHVEHFDEHRGIYGFFRRHQKKLLYTAGFFTLLTFSITGPLMALIGSIFAVEREMPTIVVNGVRVPLQGEDYTFGESLANNVQYAIPRGVLPMLNPGEDRQNQLGDVYAILRRAAIAEQIEVSMIEVDRAIEALREQRQVESVAKLARSLNFASVAQYRQMVAEAMRIGTYVKLQTLGLESSDARVLHQVTVDREKITFRVATFDEKKLQDDLQKASTLTDEDLNKWLKEKTDREKRLMQAYDAPKADLSLLALLTAEGQFDAEQWKDGYLKDFTVSEDQLQGYYEQEKENRWKLEGDKNYTPFTDEKVKAELTRLSQAEHVMNQLLAALRGKLAKASEAQTTEVTRTQAELAQKQTTLSEIDTRLATLQNDFAAKERELQAQPENAAVKEAHAAAKAAADAAKEEQFKANEAIPALKNAVKAAEDAKKAAEEAFDLFAAAKDLIEGKKGFEQKQSDKLQPTDSWKDDSLALGLGKWPTVNFGGLQKRGLGYAPGRTRNAVVVFQAKDIDLTPLKAWDKLKPLVEGAYFAESAKKQAEEKKKLMEDTLLRLAKAKMTDKVTEIEGKKQSRIDDKVKEWETTTQAAVAAAEGQVKRLKPGSQANITWEQELARKKAELGTKEQQVTRFDAEIVKAIETEIGTEAKKFHREVLDQAATESGFAVVDLPSYARDLKQNTPRFDKAFDSRTVFLMGSHASLKEGETTGLVADAVNRQYHVAVCVKVEPLTLADVTRRDFEVMRTGYGNRPFATTMAQASFSQAFTLPALEQRYELQQPAAAKTEAATNGK